MARPLKASVERLSVVVTYRVTADEHAALSAKAAMTGVALSEFSRLAVLAKPVRARAAGGGQAAPAIPFALVDQLRRVGVNLNQLTRTVNAGRDRSDDALQATAHDLRAVLADVRALLDRAQGGEA